MDKNSVFGEVLEKGQNAVANTVTNTATNTVSDLSKTVAEQMGMQPKSQTQQVSQVQNPQARVSDNAGAQPSEATREIVGDFYAPSDNTNSGNQSNSSHNSASASDNPDVQTQEKLAKVRRELLDTHKSEYYDPLFAYEKKKPEPRKADVMAQEEQQKMQELAFDQQKQNEDLATTRAKIAVEANRGVAG